MGVSQVVEMPVAVGHGRDSAEMRQQIKVVGSVSLEPRPQLPLSQVAVEDGPGLVLDPIPQLVFDLELVGNDDEQKRHVTGRCPRLPEDKPEADGDGGHQEKDNDGGDFAAVLVIHVWPPAFGLEDRRPVARWPRPAPPV